MFKIFLVLLIKEIKNNFFFNKAWLPLAFFILCLLIFPLSFSSRAGLNLEVSIAAIWISVLFANLISLDQMYKDDFLDGTLTYYRINNIPLFSVVLSKCLVQWFFCGIPIIILSPFCLYLLSGSGINFISLIISLLLGTPILTLIGSPISAIMLGASLRGPVLTFITLPFYFPTIIFGIIGANRNTENLAAEFYLLLSILSIVLVLFPLLTVKILKNITD